MSENANTSASQADAMPPLKPIERGEVSLQDIVNRLEDLVNFAMECEGRKMRDDISFVEVYKRLQEVRKAIDLLNQDQTNLLTLLSNVTGQKIDPSTAKLSEDDKKIVDKLAHLRAVCEAAKERIHAKSTISPEVEHMVEEKIEASKTSDKKKIARRKGKFRPLGGKGGWVRT